MFQLRPSWRRSKIWLKHWAGEKGGGPGGGGGGAPPVGVSRSNTSLGMRAGHGREEGDVEGDGEQAASQQPSTLPPSTAMTLSLPGTARVRRVRNGDGGSSAPRCCGVAAHP